MIYVGIDDTDTLETRGTNQLARQLAQHISPSYACVRIVRHQLLFDPRVPYTSKNGSASLVFVPRSGVETDISWLAAQLEQRMRAEFIAVAAAVPPEAIAFGHRAQQSIVAQRDAHELAARHGIFLRGLGGTCDGVIGALAAVGLAAEANDGRIVQLGEFPDDLSGVQSVATLAARGVAVRRWPEGEPIAAGEVDIGKKLRPNLRDGRFVLYVHRIPDTAHWTAMKLV
jgi:hypothetical protein